ncbi:MAG: LacI family DNA-binding transcriptional regulator [Rhodospirillales bacterium]|nr:LacI family DNA-binding transcriptional regulator [Rhodospirillales bacterium]
MAKSNRERTATLADVAKAAGVSKGTASNVFNRPKIVRREVRERVREAARSLGYHGPDPKGRLLSAGRVNAIGVATGLPLSYFFEDPFLRILMTGITEACDASGMGISLVSAANDEELAWNMSSAVVDGFILFCLLDAERLILQSRERQLPFVALGFGYNDDALSVVGVDDVAGACLAARHLLELGHRRFAVLTLEFTKGGSGRATPERMDASPFTGALNRVNGYFEAMEAFGVDTAAVPVFETENDEATVHAALEEIFAESPRPTALLAQSDCMALIAMEWLKARGVSVPGDVSVVGFDGVPESATSSPPLTTIQQPIAEIGRRAVKTILDHAGEVRRETLDVELIVRGSTAPPRKD